MMLMRDLAIFCRVLFNGWREKTNNKKGWREKNSQEEFQQGEGNLRRVEVIWEICAKHPQNHSGDGLGFLRRISVRQKRNPILNHLRLSCFGNPGDGCEDQRASWLLDVDYVYCYFIIILFEFLRHAFLPDGSCQNFASVDNAGSLKSLIFSGRRVQ